MSRLFLTGDTHGLLDIDKLNEKAFPIQSKLTKDDYVIVAGDFGGVWYGSSEFLRSNSEYIVPLEHRGQSERDDYIQKWYSKRNFTTLFIDGNHENHALLNSYPIIKWNGGLVHKITDSLFHLMRGQVYEIDDKKIFTMGGATSKDRWHRTENVSWWSSELPSEEEICCAREMLEKNGNSVDYIITHCTSSKIMRRIDENDQSNRLTEFFSEMDTFVNYKLWFFGHYHMDKSIDDKHIMVYNDIIEL